MTQECSDCGMKLDEPYAENANYVVESRFEEKEPMERFYALKHTEETRQRVFEIQRDLPEKSFAELSAEMANPDADAKIEVHVGEKKVMNNPENHPNVTEEDINDPNVDTSDVATTATAAFETREFSIDVDKFETVEVDSPDEVRDNPDIAYTYSVVERTPVQKTGLVCPDCTQDSDEIIWGIDV